MVGYVGWFRRETRGGEEEGAVVNRREGKRREGRRYVEMDFYRVSEEEAEGEARVEVNFVSFIGIPVSYRLEEYLLASRASLESRSPRDSYSYTE